MDPKKLSIRLSAKGKKEEKAGKEDRRLAPMMRALKAIHSVGAPDSMNPEDLAKQRAGQELLGRLAAPMIVMKKWEPFSLKGMAAAWVKPDWPHDRRRVILYCHGGGYTSGNLGYSRPLASKLTNATGWETLCFEYRLAPEHPFPAAVDDARKAWDYLMYLGYGARDVVVAGDSAGGNLALVLCHQLKEAGKAAPGTVGVDVALDRYDRQWPFLYPAGRDGPHHHYGLYSGSAGSLRGGKGSDLAHALASVWKF